MKYVVKPAASAHLICVLGTDAAETGPFYMFSLGYRDNSEMQILLHKGLWACT